MRERRALIAEELLLRDPVAKNEIPQLTPRLAEIYATNGPKTLTRDVNGLVAKGLLHLVNGRYQADMRVLMNLLPLTVPQGNTAEPKAQAQ